jgi:hypothetical protein
MDCPAETSLPAMQNDLWFELLAMEPGLYVVATCPEEGCGPDTTLAVYRSMECPVDPASLLAANDDWDEGCGDCSRTAFAGQPVSVHKIRVGGEGGSEPSGELRITLHEDCQTNYIPDECDIDCGTPGGECDFPGCGQSSDTNGDGIPDECCPCPEGAVTFVDPPEDFFDARQPHPIDDATALEGVDTFTVLLAHGGCCSLDHWSCFETEENTGRHPGVASNYIVGVAGGEECTITLRHPITHGEITTLVHSACGGSIRTWAFTSYPGDVDQSGSSTPADIGALIDALNGVDPVPDTQADLNRDGRQDPADILRLIDLLNGAGEYEPWLAE